jgi:hypothetical protein
MKILSGEGFGRVLVINLKRGEKLLESVKKAVKEAGIRDGVILSAIGSLQKAHFHRVVSLTDEPEDEFVVIEKPIELASLQGIIADYEPHFHMVVSDVGRTYTGHLEPDTTVVYLAELTIAEIRNLDIKRVPGEFGIATLQAR